MHNLVRLGSLYIVPHVYGLIDNCQDSAFAPINLKLPLANVIQWNPKYNLKFFVMFPMNHYCLNKNWLTHWLRKKKIKKGKLIVTFLARNRNAQVLCEVSTRHFDTRAVLLNKIFHKKSGRRKGACPQRQFANKPTAKRREKKCENSIFR